MKQECFSNYKYTNDFSLYSFVLRHKGGLHFYDKETVRGPIFLMYVSLFFLKHFLTPWNTGLFMMPLLAHVVRKLSVRHGIQEFIIVFTRVRYS
jgi:hypothetical protein